MADYLWRLELPGDRLRFTVAEVLEATGKALHPDPELGAPVMIRDIRKAPDGWGTPGHAPHPVQLEAEDWERLQLIWSRMDALQFPVTEAAWQPYLDAFHNSPNRPKGWSLTAIQRDPELQTELKRAFALQAHRERLKAAVSGGAVKVRNPITGEVADFDWQEHQDDWLMSREQFKTLCDLLSIELVDAHALPSFVIPVRPVVVPSALRTLNPAERVRYEHGASCGISGSGIGSAGDLVEVFEDLVARQREGAFTLDESAHLIAEAQGFDSKGFRQRMEEAYRAGTLTVRAPDTELPRKPSESWRPHSDIVKVADLNLWLQTQGVSYRFPGMDLLAARPLSATEKDLLVAVSDDGVLSGYDVGAARSTPSPAQPVQSPKIESIADETFSAPLQPLVHKLATRRDVLAPVVDDLLRNAANKSDHAALWNAFVHLADAPNPPPPLMQYVEGEVKYRGTDGVAVIGRDAFIKRLKRRASSSR